MRSVRRPPSDVDHLPLMAELARLERAHDGPIPELALRLWRLGSARAAERHHRETMLRLAREEVREGIRICRARDGEGGELPSREARADLAVHWRAYREELRRSRG